MSFYLFCFCFLVVVLVFGLGLGIVFRFVFSVFNVINFDSFMLVIFKDKDSGVFDNVIFLENSFKVVVDEVW